LAEGERAALRCGVAFAVVHGWQVDDDPRGAAFPVMENTGGREFFVRTTAQLMDERGLDRAGVLDLVAEQARAFTRDASEVEAIMPACLMMKRAAGL
jgi:hypothetical protein